MTYREWLEEVNIMTRENFGVDADQIVTDMIVARNAFKEGEDPRDFYERYCSVYDGDDDDTEPELSFDE